MSRHTFPPIPVVALGPGSQPADVNLNWLPLPNAVDTFSAPPPAAPASNAAREAVLALLTQAAQAVQDVARARADTALLPVQGLDHGAQALLAQVMGEGEVAAQISLPGGGALQIQETVYTGIWRVLESDAAGRLRADHLEVARVPAAVVREAQRAGAARAQLPPQPEAGLMNAPAIASEVIAAQEAAVVSDGAGCHVVNFTLQPVTQEDMAWLDRMIGGGPVGIFSRGYGKCVVTSTGLRHVWRVRYFDGMNKTLLDTLEITRVPVAVQAAAEDLADTLERLRELLAWLERGDV
ncbi:MAG: hydrogenase expression/formation protein [Burkholderiaceae bacterium]|jgi:hydrogenase-1 operon protein HyaF|nr:hydrogenase expression/formation protein [Burkholderiaceae bacterium]